MIKILTLLLTINVLLTAQNYNSNQELHNAIRNNNMDMLKYFLENSDKNVNEKDDLGYTPIHLAIRKNDLEIVTYVMKFKPNINTSDKFGDTPLIDAARNNNMEIVKLLTCAKANIHTKNQNGKTAMDFISDNKQYETALFMQNPKCEDDKEKEKKNLIEKLRKLK